MAECQGRYDYEASSLSVIEKNLSKSRLHNYLRMAGFDAEYAVQQYLYNSRMSKSFLFPLHMLEVSLRNGIDEILKDMYTQNWPESDAFRRILSQESLRTLDVAIERVKRLKKGAFSPNDVIAQLTFDFWSNLFRPEYDRSLWQTKLIDLIPNTTMKRNEFQKLVAKLNKFRNRVAHHEPIIHQDLSKIHAELLTAIKFRSTTLHGWVKTHSTVNIMLRTSPKKGLGYGPLLKDRMDRNIQVTFASDALLEFASNSDKFYLCMNNEDLLAVLSAADIGKFLAINMDETGLIDLSEIEFTQVIKDLNLENNFVTLDSNNNLSTINQLLRKNILYAVVTDNDTPVGVIAKAHRRY